MQKLSWQTRKILKKFKNVPEKHKNFKVTWSVLGHSKPKIFSVGQLWWPKFFETLPPPSTNTTILVLLQPSLFNEALLFSTYEVYRHADFTLLVNKTEICEICNSVEKWASKLSVAKIKRLGIPAKPKAPVSLTSPDRIK